MAIAKTYLAVAILDNLSGDKGDRDLSGQDKRITTKAGATLHTRSARRWRDVVTVHMQDEKQKKKKTSKLGHRLSPLRTI